MANVSAATENADQLRRRANRRLLGASVLLLVAIILVPIFLEREPPPLPDSVDVKIPPIDSAKFDPKLPERKGAPTEIPSVAEPSGAAVAAPTAAPLPTAPVAQPSPVSPAVSGASQAKKDETSKAITATTPSTNAAAAVKAEPKAAPTTPTRSPENAPAKVAEKPALKSGQWVIQLVAVRDSASAKQVFDKAKALKVPVYTEQITVSNGQVTRVRVGPFEDKKSVEAARAKLAKAGFEAKLITLP
ncbi:MAG: hypothetical protein EAZ21_09545 [Betaproteobacteria bacterium]|nr:MAG: hypothetical protein EAZ21_09545 [Betaproteobacteria bacterium]